MKHSSIFPLLALAACGTAEGPFAGSDGTYPYDSPNDQYPSFGEANSCTCSDITTADGQMVSGSCQGGIETSVCRDDHYWWGCTSSGWVQFTSIGQCDLNDGGNDANDACIGTHPCDASDECAAPCYISPSHWACVCPDASGD